MPAEILVHVQNGTPAEIAPPARTLQPRKPVLGFLVGTPLGAAFRLIMYTRAAGWRQSTLSAATILCGSSSSVRRPGVYNYRVYTAKQYRGVWPLYYDTPRSLVSSLRLILGIGVFLGLGFHNLRVFCVQTVLVC